MRNVMNILMERDGLDEEEALTLMDETREELANGNFEAMQEILGLEDDYIFDII